MVSAVVLLLSFLVVCQIQEIESGEINTTRFEKECTSEGDYVLVSDAHCKPCVCSKNYKPVCGDDQITYENDCFARCRNVKIACESECPCLSPCNCPASVFGSVCGDDFITYESECEAKCAGAEVICTYDCVSCFGWSNTALDHDPA